jgi:hypothetical protein
MFGTGLSNGACDSLNTSSLDLVVCLENGSFLYNGGQNRYLIGYFTTEPRQGVHSCGGIGVAQFFNLTWSRDLRLCSRSAA